MQYGKLIGAEFIGSPIPQDGFLPVEFTAPTEEAPEGKQWDYTWMQDDAHIYQVWHLTDYVEPIDYPSADEILNILLGGDAE